MLCAVAGTMEPRHHMADTVVSNYSVIPKWDDMHIIYNQCASVSLSHLLFCIQVDIKHAGNAQLNQI